MWVNSWHNHASQPHEILLTWLPTLNFRSIIFLKVKVIGKAQEKLNVDVIRQHEIGLYLLDFQKFIALKTHDNFAKLHQHDPLPKVSTLLVLRMFM